MAYTELGGLTAVQAQHGGMEGAVTGRTSSLTSWKALSPGGKDLGVFHLLPGRFALSVALRGTEPAVVLEAELQGRVLGMWLVLLCCFSVLPPQARPLSP